VPVGDAEPAEDEMLDFDEDDVQDVLD